MKLPASLTRLALLAPLIWFGASAQRTSTDRVRGIVVADMDRSVKPGDNFFLFSNGNWLKRTEIPPDRASVGVFSRLADIADKRTAALIEDVSKSNPAPGSGERKISDLYRSYMDEAGIESKGRERLKSRLDAIAAIHDKRELAHAFGESMRADVDPLNNTNFHTSHLFGLWVAPGFNDPEHYTPYLLQGGLEMPDREYYLSDSEHMRNIRTEYVAHVTRMLKLAGVTEPDARAKRIFEIEHAIAEKHWSLEENQDISKVNNPWKRSDFAARAPGLDWDQFFQGAGLAEAISFIVWQPTAFTGEAALVNSTPLETWKDWLSYRFIESYADVLAKGLGEERFRFFGELLSGTPKERPRPERAVFFVDGILGDEVGKVYARRYFPPEAKARVQAMVKNIVAAFRARIDRLTWMAAATKAEAQAKLDTLYVGLGYPETWRDYSGLEIRPDDAFGNLWQSDLFEYHRRVNRLGKEVDRHEWSMTPQTVNAVNLPLQNALNFPAAILEPPFFDPDAPDAANYGAIGAIIGHEVSHTFDSEGSAFDAKGALRNWWTPADRKHFNASTEALATQYSNYRPFPDLSLNGKQTLAENIADLGGISASYDGYRAALGGRIAPVAEGFSGDQQFFIAYGQAHQSKSREAALRRQVATDEHAPAEFRTATVRNLDAWYQAFNVQPGEALYLGPPDRVRIW
ncbi:MAG: M13 family metallopeptidase [Acidobacteria bacterium]|nr:M13 family metallopeptidase [Acidobacteriota bacterium]